MYLQAINRREEKTNDELLLLSHLIFIYDYYIRLCKIYTKFNQSIELFIGHIKQQQFSIEESGFSLAEQKRDKQEIF